MKDLISTIENWFGDNHRVALATVIRTWSSAPRKIGSHMAICENMEFCGSVTGGCVEAQVVAIALECMENSVARRTRFGITDDDALEAGLSCGGEVEILVQPLPRQVFAQIRNALRHRRPITYETLVPETESAQAISIVQNDGLLPVLAERSDGKVFINPLRPLPRLIISGGSHISQVLSTLAMTINYEVTIIEPRRAFAAPQRFAAGTTLVNSWPQDVLSEIELDIDTAVIALAHDSKLDDPLLSWAITSPAFYIGALGSHQTHTGRRNRLLAKGHTEAEIGRISAPIGIEIGASSPAEIAVAIIAEIVAIRNVKLDEPMENLVP